MANITIAGAQYSSVPSINVPRTGGGTATFVDTSADTVTPATLGLGYTAHNASGALINGEFDINAVVAALGGRDVNFYDYDGSLLYAYSAADFAGLSSMPANPSHEGLTAQGWNWTLSDAKTYAASYGKLNIGQKYTTNDGKTRLYINVEDASKPMTLRFGCSNANGVNIDWGDGSTETSDSTDAKEYSHTYASTGDYVIKLTVASGATLDMTGTSGISGNGLFGSHASSNTYNHRRIKKAEIGSGISSIGTAAFMYCYDMESIVIPDSVTAVSISAFESCYKLINITLSGNNLTIANVAFRYCYGLESLCLNNGVTSIGTSAFVYCVSLTGVTLPGSCTTISGSAFQYCASIQYAVVPGTVGISNAAQFQYCYRLAYLYLGNGITDLSTSMFYGCVGLKRVTGPATVTSIAASAFNGAAAVEEYHILNSTPPTLAATNAFNSINRACVIYVPKASLSTYQGATNWSTYSSYMQGE